MATNLSGMRMNLNEGSSLGTLLERIAIVMLITAVSALLFLLFFQQDLQVSREVLKYALFAALGVVAGFSARYLLATQTIYLCAPPAPTTCGPPRRWSSAPIGRATYIYLLRLDLS